MTFFTRATAFFATSSPIKKVSVTLIAVLIFVVMISGATSVVSALTRYFPRVLPATSWEVRNNGQFFDVSATGIEVRTSKMLLGGSRLNESGNIEVLVAAREIGILRKIEVAKSNGSITELNSQSLSEVLGTPEDGRLLVMDLSQSRESLFLSSITYFNNFEKCDLFNIYEIKNSDLFKKTSKAKSIYQWPGCASFPQDTGWHNFAGRLAISDTSIYMTAGFIDSDAYTNVKLQTAPDLDGSLFGQVLKIDLATYRVQEFASGLRSPAGIVTVDSPEGDALYVTEHGPKGGDELNFISTGSDYGWPKVSLGLPYVGDDGTGAGTRYGTHQGFAPPMFSWTPSIAPSAIIELTGSLDGYGSWQKGDLVFGTLKNQSLVRIKIANQQTVTTVEEMKIGFRIRDLEQVGDVVVLGSDDGRIATIQKKSKIIGDGPYPSVDELSPIYKVPGLGQISKFFDDFIISVFQALN